MRIVNTLLYWWKFILFMHYCKWNKITAVRYCVNKIVTCDTDLHVLDFCHSKCFYVSHSPPRILPSHADNLDDVIVKSSLWRIISQSRVVGADKEIGRSIVSGRTSNRATRTSLWQMNLPIHSVPAGSKLNGLSWWRLHNGGPPSAARVVRHTNRLTSLPGCHRFILRASPWSWARQGPRPSPPAPAHLHLPASDLYWVLTRRVLRAPDAGTHGSMVYWESLPFYGVISFILPFPPPPSLARDSAPRSRLGDIDTGLVPAGGSHGKKEESHKAAQSRLSSREIESRDTGRISSGLPRAGNSTRLDTTLCIFSRTKIARDETGVKHY